MISESLITLAHWMNRQYSPFVTGKAPFNYAKDMPHDGWRDILPYIIDTYKNGVAEFNEEKLVYWYRNSLADDCGAGDTTGNTAQQLQIEFPPDKVMQDRVFVTALLREYAELEISGQTEPLTWDFIPDNQTGLYHTSFPLSHNEGIQLTIVRDDVGIFDTVTGQNVGPEYCINGLTNWNAWVGSYTTAAAGFAVKPAHTLQQQKCVQGYGAGNFDGLCQFTCKYGYVSQITPYSISYTLGKIVLTENLPSARLEHVFVLVWVFQKIFPK